MAEGWKKNYPVKDFHVNVPAIFFIVLFSLFFFLYAVGGYDEEYCRKRQNLWLGKCQVRGLSVVLYIRLLVYMLLVKMNLRSK